MADPTVKLVVTADGSQAGREVTKAGAELTKLGVVSVTVGNLLANMGQRALSAGKDLARFPLDAALATGRYVEQLDNLTTETGLAADEQQAYDVILNRSGLGLQDLSSIWRVLSQNVIASRDPMSDAAAKFRQLGIELNGSEGPNEVLQLVAERLQALPDGFKKNTLATELLGRSGAQFLPAFKEGLAGAANEAKRLGTILNDEARAKAAAFDLATDDLSAAWQGLTHQIGVLAAPVLTDLTRNLTEATAKTSKWAAELSGAKKEAESLVDTVRRMGPGATQFVPPPGLAGGGIRGGATPPTKEEMAALGLIEAQDQAARAATTAGERQEALGRAAVLRSQQAQFNKAHMTELQPGLASTFDIDQVQAKEKVDESSRARPDTTGFNEIQKGMAALRELMPASLDANELLQNVLHNLDTGHAIVTAGVDDWQSYRDGLSDAAESARVLESSQAELYQTESGFIGAADAARRLSFDRIAAEEAQKRQLILDTFGESERAHEKLLDLELQSEAQRRAVVRQFPTFFEQQMQSIVKSNTFSVGAIVTTWTSGVAGAIVNGGNFIDAAWKSTQLAIVQGALNTGVQLAAQWALQASVEMGILTATEAAKLGLKTTTNATIVAGDAAAAGATVGIWSGAALAISGAFAATLAGFQAMIGTMVGMLTAVGTFVMGVLTAIAEALYDTIFGSPWAAAITIGVIGIAAALAATGNLGFREGGIGNFGDGTQTTLHGQEAIIPLDGRGARFMNQLGFGGGGRAQTINVPVYLDGRQIAFATARHLPGAFRREGAPA
jgi:hypothetical protein